MTGMLCWPIWSQDQTCPSYNVIYALPWLWYYSYCDFRGNAYPYFRHVQDILQYILYIKTHTHTEQEHNFISLFCSGLVSLDTGWILYLLFSHSLVFYCPFLLFYSLSLLGVFSLMYCKGEIFSPSLSFCSFLPFSLSFPDCASFLSSIFLSLLLFPSSICLSSLRNVPAPLLQSCSSPVK